LPFLPCSFEGYLADIGFKPLTKYLRKYLTIYFTWCSSLTSIKIVLMIILSVKTEGYFFCLFERVPIA
jgi:hypothetical protein